MEPFLKKKIEEKYSTFKLIEILLRTFIQSGLIEPVSPQASAPIVEVNLFEGPELGHPNDEVQPEK